MSHGELTIDPAPHAALVRRHAGDADGARIRDPAHAAGAARIRVFTRELILDAAYAGNIHVADRTIDSHIRNIRAKMAAAGCETVIETVHGVGFRLGRCEASR